MRHYLPFLFLLGSLSACGDGADEGDTSAPALSLSTAQSVVGAGEAVAISVTATDDVDASVRYALRCSAGTLTGNILVAPDVTADTIVTCTAEATDAAGNAGSGTVRFTVSPSGPVVVMPAGTEQVAAGASGLLLVDNLALTADRYEGTLGTTPVTLARAGGDTLVFTVPLAAATGAQRLSVTIAGRTFTQQLEVTAAPVVADPRGRIAAHFAEARALLETQRDAADAADRPALQSRIDQVVAAAAAVPQLDEASAATLASVLAANGVIGGSASAALGYTPIPGNEPCLPHLARFSRAAGHATIGAIWAVSSVYIGAAVASAAPITVIPDIIFTGLGISVGAAWVVIYGRQAADAYDAMYAACWAERSVDVLSFLNDTGARGPAMAAAGPNAAAITVTAKQAFTNRVSRTFRVRRTFGPQENIRARITPTINRFVSKVGAVPLLPDNLRQSLAKVKVEGTEYVPAARLSLGSLSRGDISGTLAAVGEDAIRLTFTYAAAAQPPEPIDFSFTLNRAQENAIEVPAQLGAGPPEADDAAVSVAPNRTTTAQLQVRGATSLEVVDAPDHGTVTLAADGSFAYTPAAGYTGPDRFTYRARNAAGASAPATVLITVQGDLAGVYYLTIVDLQLTSPACGPGSSSSGLESKSLIRVNDGYQFLFYQNRFDLRLLPDGNGGFTGRTDSPLGLTGFATGTLTATGELSVRAEFSEYGCDYVRTYQGDRTVRETEE